LGFYIDNIFTTHFIRGYSYFSLSGKFNRYFLCGIIKDTKCINASDIKVYKAKCREIDKYNNLNAPEVKTYIANPKE